MLRGFSLLVLTLSAGFAQIGTSTITGRVVDASGPFVPNVAITILQKTTNFTFQAVTNEGRAYRVSLAAAGELIESLLRPAASRSRSRRH
jgi:hypothetical protein